MKLSVATLFTLAFATVNAVSMCGSKSDCCWKDAEACWKKVGVNRCPGGRFPTEVGHMCINNGVTLAQCNADCCSVSRKVGISCR